MDEKINSYIQYMYSYPHKTAYRRLKDIYLQDYMGQLSGGRAEAGCSLYFHIPFCQYKCGYCNLFSLAGASGGFMEEYVDSMERQAEQWAGMLPGDVRFSDFTLGGGTPLILPEHLLRRIFRIARDYFGMDCQKCPVIVETSPNQTTEEKCSLLKEEGVTRISLGIQSFHPKELEVLHRHHPVEQAQKAIEIIQSSGIDCLNLDFIYGIPGQSIETLRDTLLRAFTYHPEELFVYPLYIKPETALDREQVKPSGNIAVMGRFVREFLREHGYMPYSMRRFVRQTCETLSGVRKGASEQARSLHGEDRGRGTSPSLCGFGNTLALGCGGRSYIGNLHFCTPYAVRQESCRQILESYIGQRDYCRPSHGFLLSGEEQRRRYVIKHILFETGIDRRDYRQHFAGEPEFDFPCLKGWIADGYAVSADDRIYLTEEGFLLSDYLGPQLISEEVRRRMDSFGRE